MISDKEYFILFSNCIPVKGVNRSIICDLQLERYGFIPNLLFDILKETKQKSINEIKGLYLHKLDDGIDSYINLLVSENWGTITTDPSQFPDLDFTWEHPSNITNAIIDFDKDSKYDLESIFKELDILGCEALQVRLFGITKKKQLNDILTFSNSSQISHINLIIGYNPKLLESFFIDLMIEYLRLRAITVYGAPFDKKIDLSKIPDARGGSISYIKKYLADEHDCGAIFPSDFRSNVSLFTESQKHNTCLNRKLAIDKHGNIKNCPSLPTSFGNINSTSLIDVIKKRKFKKYWFINKDRINICKDCEFRYICTDCRAYLSEPGDDYSKPLKCGYNPSTNIWEDWSTNQLKQKVIKYYQTV